MKIDQLILYAPNVHTGGGVVLLQALLAAWPRDRPLIAFFDKRAAGYLKIPTGCFVNWVKPTLSSRMRAELSLQRASIETSIIFCFHNLPPFMRVKGTVIVFHQNRVLLGLDSLQQYPLRVAARIATEQLMARIFRHRVDRYIVQTPTMAYCLAQWYANCGKRASPTIDVMPFVEQPKSSNSSDTFKWDFIYVANGVAHKNHVTLFHAWRELALQGIRPTLAVTIDENDKFVINLLHALQKDGFSHIVNLRQLPHDEILALYRNTKAVIFPSLSESFGLPLIEAKHFGLPILASELDFVRDVCQPAQTFDPTSPRSIARSVKRFMRIEDNPVRLLSPAEFWDCFSENHERCLKKGGHNGIVN